MEYNHCTEHRLPRGAFVMNPVHLLLTAIVDGQKNEIRQREDRVKALPIPGLSARFPS